jgi:hypothetical protein
MAQDQGQRKEYEDKDYVLNLEDKGGYLEAIPRGKRTRETVSALTEEIAKACIEVHCSKILVDVKELEGLLKVLDSYNIVTQDFRKLRGKGIQKVAIVDQAAPGLGGWFIETVAVNRGFNLRVFSDRKLALEWLLGKPQPERK